MADIPRPPGDLSVCPYCGANTTVTASTVVYSRDFGQLLLCEAWPKCDAYVGMHKGTDIPKGTLANRELRDLRKRVHTAFDPLWQFNRMPRAKAYELLAEAMGLPVGEAHIAWFNVEQCQRAIARLGEIRMFA